MRHLIGLLLSIGLYGQIGGNVPPISSWVPSFALTTASLNSATYTSGITATGTVGQTCTLDTFNASGTATATVALTGTNTIAGGTALVITSVGSGFTTTPTTAVSHAGTAAACSGTATISSVIRVLDLAGQMNVFIYLPGVSNQLLPVGQQGMQRCYRSQTGKTVIITIAVQVSNTIDLAGVNGTTSTGTLVSGGAAGDAICLISDAANHWSATSQKGTWTNN